MEWWVVCRCSATALTGSNHGVLAESNQKLVLGFNLVLSSRSAIDGNNNYTNQG